MLRNKYLYVNINWFSLLEGKLVKTIQIINKFNTTTTFLNFRNLLKGDL